MYLYPEFCASYFRILCFVFCILYFTEQELLREGTLRMRGKIWTGGHTRREILHQNSKMLFPFSYLESHMFKHYKSSHWGLGGAGGFVRIQRFHRDKACQRQRAEASLFSTRASHSYSSFLHLVTSPSDFVRAPHLLNSSSKANFNFWAICVLLFWFLMIALAIVFANYISSTTMVVALWQLWQ